MGIDQLSIDNHWMQLALTRAQQAYAQDEVPVGAIIIYENNIIGEGWNQPITLHDPTAHAEILAMRQASQLLQNYRLLNSTLYVTLEPCVMCIGAMLHARIGRLVFGARDPKVGATNLIFTQQQFNHRFEVVSDIRGDECAKILKQFFMARRK